MSAEESGGDLTLQGRSALTGPPPRGLRPAGGCQPEGRQILGRDQGEFTRANRRRSRSLVPPGHSALAQDACTTSCQPQWPWTHCMSSP